MGFSGANLLTIVTPLFGIGLISTSAYSWWNTSHLHLHISRVVAFLCTFLPILSLAAIQFLRIGSGQQVQQGNSKSRNRRKASPTQFSDKSIALTFFLLLVDTSLLTLSSTTLPSKPLLCPLNESWQALWSSPTQRHLAKPAIETIQNSLDCCGLHSPQDKFYPFPPYFNGTHPPCTDFYPNRVGKTCYQPWLEQTQLSAGLLLFTAIGSALMKILALVLIRYNSSPSVQAFLYKPWFGESSQQQGAQQSNEQTERRIHDVESDGDEEYVYDSDARVRRDGLGHDNGAGSTDRGRYIDAAAGEHERLLGNTENGENRRNDYYVEEGGFGTLQPSSLIR